MRFNDRVCGGQSQVHSLTRITGLDINFCCLKPTTSFIIIISRCFILVPRGCPLGSGVLKELGKGRRKAFLNLEMGRKKNSINV